MEAIRTESGMKDNSVGTYDFELGLVSNNLEIANILQYSRLIMIIKSRKMKFFFDEEH